MDSFQAAQFGQIDIRRSEGDAAMLGFAREGDAVRRRTSKRFGRNATAVQADAAETLVALDQDDFLAEVSGVKSRGISTGPGANYTISVLIGSI